MLWKHVKQACIYLWDGMDIDNFSAGSAVSESASAAAVIAAKRS